MTDPANKNTFPISMEPVSSEEPALSDGPENSDTTLIPDKPVRVYRTTDITSILAGIPGASHRHFRAAIETPDGIFVFQEATIAALVRAYIGVTTHPTRRAVYMKGGIAEGRKKEYAAWQLAEGECTGEEAEEMLKRLLDRAE